MAHLQGTHGPLAGKRLELHRAETVLGRHPACDVVIDAGAVSRNHARVSRTGADYFIEDLESRNSTFVNDGDIKGQGRQRLRHGDAVRICDSTFLFVDDEQELFRPISDDSALGTVLVDDEERHNSTIMSSLDVSSSDGRVTVAASPEAKLAALIDITQNLSRALSLDDVLPKLLESLFKIFFQADRGFIVIADDAGNLVPRWTKLRRESQDDTIRVSRTIVRRVMDSREAILSADAISDSQFSMSESLPSLRIRSMMCAPLVSTQGEPIGVLQIDTLDQRNRFTDEDLEVLVAVAAQASVSIENARLYEETIRQRALERDLTLAHRVQQGFLPQERPSVPGYGFFDFYRPANHVGGDYFDYIPLPDGRWCVVVADVVGHGIAAALLMARVAAEARFHLASSSRPAEAVTKLNRSLCQVGLEDRFVTLVLTVLDPHEHRVTIVNAGHMAPMIRRTNGLVEEAGDEQAGLPLGIVDVGDYEQCDVVVEAGEWLALYTDGINECENPGNQRYGIARLRDKVAQTAGLPQDVGKLLIDDVYLFVGDGSQEDDMCLVCYGREPVFRGTAPVGRGSRDAAQV